MSLGGAHETRRAPSRFVRAAVGVLVLNLGVVLWGAVVRATGSGAGCGSHWPLCNGEVVPIAPAQTTLIEYVHRLLSGLALIAVGALWVWALRRFPRGHSTRRWATAALVLILVEALVGAGLVLMRWVGVDASIGRVVSIAVHLLITYALLGSLTLTAWSARLERAPAPPATARWAVVFVAGMALVGISGAVTALGDTLFPSSSLAQGLALDLSAQAHFLVRLRVFHPLIAATVGVAAWIWAGERRAALEHPEARRWLGTLQTALAFQLIAGILNLALLAPLWLQIVHLFLADAAWILLVVCLAEGRGEDRLVLDVQAV